ncbi:MAG: PilN domain-containing protein, partial [Burkholderiaceae bacterium]|nr:PilN domain-containing protein [Burkholderiaceae bacterium]
MAFTHDNSRFFGLDLSQLPRQWRAAAQLLAGLPGFARLTPAVPVALRQADGHVSHWQVTRGVAAPDASGAFIGGPAARAADDAAIWALELASSRVLERHLMLPRLADADRAQAVQLDAASSSPFPAGQMAYGYAVQPDGRVDEAITSRAQVDLAQIEARAAGWQSGGAPEIWVIPPSVNRNGLMRPIVIGGYGEDARQRLAARGFARHLALMALGAILLAALLVTPTAFTRMRAHQAMAAQDALEHHAGAQIAAREALMAQVQSMQALHDLVDRQIALPPALDMLTRAVPDGAWLTSLRAEGAK